IMNCPLKEAACKWPRQAERSLPPVGLWPAWVPCVWSHDTDPAPVARSREAKRLYCGPVAVVRSPGALDLSHDAHRASSYVEDSTRGTVSPPNLRSSVLKVLGTSIRGGTDTQRAISAPGKETSLGLRPRRRMNHALAGQAPVGQEAQAGGAQAPGVRACRPGAGFVAQPDPPAPAGGPRRGPRMLTSPVAERTEPAGSAHEPVATGRARRA